MKDPPCDCPGQNCNEPKKKLKMSSDLVSKFKAKAHHNTLNRIETGGLLLGTDEGDHFNLSTVFLPSQSGNNTNTVTCL